MKLIDGDHLTERMMSDAITDSQCLTAVRVEHAVKTEPEIDAIPTAYIRKLITQPECAGRKSSVLSWILREWEENKHNSD